MSPNLKELENNLKAQIPPNPLPGNFFQLRFLLQLENPANI
jgi:hypothetical protein